MNNKVILTKLEDELVRLLDLLATLEPETAEYKETITLINGLYETLKKEKDFVVDEQKIQVESQKVENDTDVKYAEIEMQEKQLKDSKVWNGLKVGVELVGIALPLAAYAVWYNRGLEFEKEGTITSGFVKGLIGKFKPTR